MLTIITIIAIIVITSSSASIVVNCYVYYWPMAKVYGLEWSFSDTEGGEGQSNMIHYSII